MDPVSMMAVASVGTAVLGAGSTLYKAKSDADAMNAQAGAEQAKAVVDAQWADRRAKEERAAAQSQASVEVKAARLAQSRLGAVAGASGSGASDPTVMQLWEGLEKQGQSNAAMAQVAGQQKASGIDYQSAMNRWSADQNAAIKRASAKSTMVGGTMGAFGQILTPMAQRYGQPSATGSGTGYGSSYDPSRWSHTSTVYG